METLEEAAERNHNEQKLNTYTPYSFNDAFKDGAKWQAERMYSQEEDAAKNKYPIENTGAMFMPNRHEVTNIYKQEAFIAGANWQAERMYSQEEVVDLIEDWTKMAKGLNMNFPSDKFEEWFKQFERE